MKRFLLLGNFFFLSLVIRAQQDYFLFIQSENNQPYYIQSDGKTLSSSAIGHLIISGLKDSLYRLTIGFPKNQYPEQVFQLRINKKDAGYQLKNIGNDGWALFNLQTLQLINVQPNALRKQTITYGELKKTDVFSILMAGLVNDSAVLYSSITKIDSVKENSQTSISDAPPKIEIVKKDEVLKKDTTVSNPIVITDPIAKIPEKKSIDSSIVTQSNTVKPIAEEMRPVEIRPLIVELSERKNDIGTELVFLDMISSDTITILILKEVEIDRKEITPKEVRASEDPGQKKETQKRTPGKLFAKIFGKKDKSSASKIDSIESIPSESNTPLVKVNGDTVRSIDSQAANNNQEKKKQDDIKNENDNPRQNEKKKDEERNTPSKLIAKIFGKKKKSEVSNMDTVVNREPAPNTPAVKVITTDTGRSIDSLSQKEDERKKVVLVNSNCRQFAGSSDVDKIRIKMLGEKDADGQIAEARKVFKIKCFTTVQIKALTELFRTDEGRYKFFDAAYPFVYDSENFSQLIVLLKEEYYINRFKAMVRM